MRTVKDAGQRVVVVGRNRIELVIVTSRTSKRQSEKRFADSVDVVIDHVADDLFLVGITAVPDAVRQKMSSRSVRRG